jgi:two-component system response regulator AtoC
MSNDPTIDTRHLPYFLSSSEDQPPLIAPSQTQSYAEMGEKDENSLASEGEFNLHVLEMHTIRLALQHTDNNRTDAARLLGISRRTLQRKLKELESKP